jgi:hypothetical protein
MRRYIASTAFILATAALSCCTSCILHAEELRTWTDATGKHKRVAAFQRLEGDFVFLRTEEGKETKVPLEKLSEADQSYARNAAATDAPPDPFQESAPPSAPRVQEVDPGDDDAEEDPGLRVVIAEGVGGTIEKAKKDAYREAVRQVVGGYVDSSQLLKNDKLIEDRIIMLSSAYVEKASPPLTKVTEDGVVRIKLKAWVRLTKVLETLKQNNVVLKVDNNSFTAELQTKADQGEGEEALMSRVFAAFPANSINASLEGKPEIKKASGNQVVIRIGVTFEPNLEQYAAVAQKIEAALGSTGRPMGQFAVDGKAFPENMRNGFPESWFTSNSVLFNRNGFGSVLPTAEHSRLEAEKTDKGRSAMLDVPSLYHLWPGDDPNGGLYSLRYGKWEKLRPTAGAKVILLVMTKSNKTGQRTQWKWFLLDKEEAERWVTPARKKLQCTITFFNGNNDELLEDTFTLSHMGWQVLGRSSRQHVYVCSPFVVDGSDGDWYAPSFTYTRQIDATSDEIEGLSSVKCSLVNGETQSFE